ncbi:MAG: rod-binding protein, partial [Gallionella sp.]|nr:rod-binding protein [Gallionella sp.]
MTNSLNTTANLAIDTQSLGQLRAQAKQSPDQALKAAAQQFEAVFMNMMLKSMREASPQDSPFDNEQSRTFTAMLDQQLS